MPSRCRLWLVGRSAIRPSTSLIAKAPEILGGLGIVTVRAGVANSFADLIKEFRLQAEESAKRNLHTVLALVIVAPLLVGCAGGTFAPEEALDRLAGNTTPGAGGKSEAGEAPKDRNSLQVVADKVLPAETDELRNIRVCGFGAIGAEIMTDRARLFDPQDAPASLGHAVTILASIEAIKAAPTTAHFYNAEMANVVIALAQVYEAGATNRVLGALGRGLNVDNVLGSVQRVAVSTYKGREMVRDLRRLMDQVRSKELTYEAAWTACRNRIDHNRQTLRVLNGAPPVPPPAGQTSTAS